MINFEAEVDRRIAGIEVPGIEVDPSMRVIATQALKDADRDFGEDSTNPKTHHNALHGLDNMGRGIALINPVHDLIPSKYQEFIYDLQVNDGALHDRFQGMKVKGANEILSAAYGINLINEHGSSRINTSTFKYRSADGVISTTAFFENGSLVLPKLLNGRPDTHKFFMVAADVYAPIAMGGTYEMLDASRKLTSEYFDNPTPTNAYSFVTGEVSFLKEGLNPDRIREVLARFFPKTSDQVYWIYHELFNSNIEQASEFAKAVGRRTDKAEVIGEAVLAGEFEEVGEIVGLPVTKIE